MLNHWLQNDLNLFPDKRSYLDYNLPSLTKSTNVHNCKSADGQPHVKRGRRDVRNLPQQPGVNPDTRKPKGADKDRPKRNRGEQPRWQQDGGGKWE